METVESPYLKKQICFGEPIQSRSEHVHTGETIVAGGLQLNAIFLPSPLPFTLPSQFISSLFLPHPPPPSPTLSFEAEGDTTGEVTVDSVRSIEVLDFRATSNCKEEGSREKEESRREGKKGEKGGDRVREVGRRERGRAVGERERGRDVGKR